jgi:hypothetical protein
MEVSNHIRLPLRCSLAASGAGCGVLRSLPAPFGGETVAAKLPHCELETIAGPLATVHFGILAASGAGRVWRYYMRFAAERLRDQYDLIWNFHIISLGTISAAVSSDLHIKPW